MPTPAKLILLPNVLNDEERDIQSYFTKAVIDLVPTLDGLIAERVAINFFISSTEGRLCSFMRPVIRTLFAFGI